MIVATGWGSGSLSDIVHKSNGIQNPSVLAASLLQTLSCTFCNSSLLQKIALEFVVCVSCFTQRRWHLLSCCAQPLLWSASSSTHRPQGVLAFACDLSFLLRAVTHTRYKADRLRSWGPLHGGSIGLTEKVLSLFRKPRLPPENDREFLNTRTGRVKSMTS